MKRPNVEYDLLMLFKKTPQKDLLTLIAAIADGRLPAYQKRQQRVSPGEVSPVLEKICGYLDKISQEEMLLRLEKVIVLANSQAAPKKQVSNSKPYYCNAPEEFARQAQRFSELVQDVRYRDINAKTPLASQYQFLLRKAKLKNALTSKKTLTLGLSMALIVIALLALPHIVNGNAATVAADTSYDMEALTTAIVTMAPEASAEVTSLIDELSTDNVLTVTPLPTTTPEVVVTPVVTAEPITPAPTEMPAPIVTSEPEHQLTTEQQIQYILSEYDLTQAEFDVMAAIVSAEAKYSYEDAYWVINCIYNRTISKAWSAEFSTSLYAQAVAKNARGHTQFSAYTDGRYQQFLGKIDTPMFQAILDFLMTKDCRHEYLQFRAWYWDFGDQFNEPSEENGNRYFSPLKSEDLLTADAHMTLQ